MIKEADITLNIKLPESDVSRSMNTFYNPKMESHRNITITAINTLINSKNKQISIALPLAGSGIRAFRILKEISNKNVSELHINDQKTNFNKEFQANLKLNNLNSKENQKIINIHNQDANIFLLSHIGFDYIDVDPFGSPNPFLSAAVNKINRKGILAITATDTGALAGTYPKACQRKYWAKPLKCYMMHELGLRILIRKVQLQGVQFGKALTPIFSYHKNHYYRIFFKSENGKEKCNLIQSQHQYFLYDPKTLETKVSTNNTWKGKEKSEFQITGPLYVGHLHNQEFIEGMLKQNIFESETKFLKKIHSEASNQNVVGFIDSHILAKKFKIKTPTNEQLQEINDTWSTQFSKSAIKTPLSPKELIKKLKTK